MAIGNLTIEQVQRWVISFLICSVTLFPTGAMIAAVSAFADHRRDDAIVLLVVMAILDCLALVAARIVHRKSPVSPIVLLGTIPALVAGAILL
jgi:hypothetical protein